MKINIKIFFSIALLALFVQTTNVAAQRTCNRDYCAGLVQSCIHDAYAMEYGGASAVDLTPCFDLVRGNPYCAGVNISMATRPEYGGQRYLNDDGTQYVYLSCEGTQNGLWLNRKQ